MFITAVCLLFLLNKNMFIRYIVVSTSKYIIYSVGNDFQYLSITPRVHLLENTTFLAEYSEECNMQAGKSFQANSMIDT